MSNQCVGLQEDAENKPWRPIPSKRITVVAARRLRWAALAVCLVLSARSGVLLPSVALALATLAYNELRLDSHWASRHVCNALGYAAFNAGATYVGCSGKSGSTFGYTVLRPVVRSPPFTSTSVYMTIFTYYPRPEGFKTNLMHSLEL